MTGRAPYRARRPAARVHRHRRRDRDGPADLVTEGLLVIALGWLLTTGARTLDRRLALERLLRGATVREAMREDPPFVGPNLTIDTFVNRYEGADGVPAIPVVDDEQVLGIIGRRRLQRLGKRRFGTTRAADVMAVPPQAPLLAPDDPLWEALDVMSNGGSRASRWRSRAGSRGSSRATACREAVRVRAGRRGRPGGRPMSGDLLRVEEAQATVLAGVAPIADTETVGPGARARPGARGAAHGRRVAAAVGQLGDGRLRDPARRTWRRRGSGRPSGSRSSGSRAPGTPPTPACCPGPPSGSPPGPRCRPAPTPSCRSSSRRRSTRRGGAGPRGRDAAGPLPAACLVHERVAVGNAVRTMRRRRPRGDGDRAGPGTS